MDRPRRVFNVEPLAVALIFGCVAATLVTVIAVHRRPQAPRPAMVVVAASVPEVKVVEAPAPKPLPAPPAPKPAPAPAPEDPTKPIVAELAKAEAEQRLETVRSDRQVAAIDAATRAAKAESERWKRGLTLTRSQLEARAADARRRESLVETAFMERDALARRRDGLKKTLESDRARPSYAVLPHKGPNGTWQRPIVLECKDESVTLRPNGPTFGLSDLSTTLTMRVSPFAAAISREAVRIQRQAGPDGADIVPYIFFIIRPDGIRAYYEARTRLERLGIAFGYELADPDWAIDVPDLDQPSTWDGSPPPASTGNDSFADLGTPRGEGPNRGAGSGRATQEEVDNAFTWPKSAPGMDEAHGRSEMSGGYAGLGAPLDRLVPGIEGGDGNEPGKSTAKPGPSGGGRTGMSAEVWNRALGGSGLSNGTGETPGSAADRSRAGTDRGQLAGRQGGVSGGRGVGGDGTVEGAVGDRSPTGTDRGQLAGRQGGVSGGRGVGESSRGGVGGPGGDASEGGQPGDPGSLANSSSGGDANGMSRPPGQGGGTTGEVRASGRGNGRSEAGGGSGSPGQGGEAGGVGSPGAGGGGGGQPSRFGGTTRPARAMEFVVACSPQGVSVHPGNYRVTAATLKSKEDLLSGQLRALVRQKEQAEPGTTVEPSIRYIIEQGGHQTYTAARAQVVFTGIDWPTSFQVSDGEPLRLFSTDAWK